MTTIAHKEHLLTQQILHLLSKTDQGSKSLDEYYGRRNAFARDILGMNLWSKQEEILDALDRNHDQLAVVAGNGVGKSFLAPVPALYTVFVLRDTCLVTGPTGRSVRNILMRGTIATAFHASGLEGSLTDFQLKTNNTGRIVAFASKDVSRIQGFHSEFLLAIVDEAQGVEPEVFDGLYACLTGDSNQFLLFGNPLTKGTPFHDACESAAWHTIKISVLDHPNITEKREVIKGAITLKKLQSWKVRLGEDSDEYRSRVLAQFPDADLDTQLFDKESLMRSAARHAASAQPRDPVWEFGVDVSRSGPNASVLCARAGRYVKRFYRWSGQKTMATVGKICEILRDDFQIGPKGSVAQFGPGVLRETRYNITVDAGGVGGGVVDRLKEKKYAVTEFDFSKSANSDRFQNRRAEVYAELADQVERDLIDIPFNRELIEELLCMHWVIPRSEGRKQLVGKDQIKRKLRRSPDLADALAMTCAQTAPVASGLASMLTFF